MSQSGTIPSLNIRSLFDDASALRARTDTAFITASTQVGFMEISGVTDLIDLGARRREALKRIFHLDPSEQRPLWRQKFAPDHPNVYRGWFPLQPGHATLKEGIDLGPDVLAAVPPADASDPLLETTPLPSEQVLPGWRAVAAEHYWEMSRLGAVLMRRVARGLGLEEVFFDAMFEGGISTLRLIRYPDRTDGPDGLVGAAHVDSGLVTLLLQDGVSGLQVRTQRGEFIDVPAKDDTIIVNFGRLLELWSSGRIKATEHRVTGGGRERYSFPFFYEPRVNARIAPLPGSSPAFTPFLYGDFVWRAATRFVEFSGLEGLRPDRGPGESIGALIA